MNAEPLPSSTVAWRWNQRLVRSVPALRGFFWVPAGCLPDVPALVAAVNEPGKPATGIVQILKDLPSDPAIPGDRCNDPVFVARLSPGKVIGDSLLVASADDRVAGNMQSLHGVSDPLNHWVLRRCRYRRAAALPGTAALLAAGAGANYFHWLLESLPRLQLMKHAGYALDHLDHVLLNQNLQPFHAETLDLLGISPGQRKLTRKNQVLLCEQLIVPSLPAPSMVYPGWALAYLRHTFLPAARTSGNHPRIFISRRRAARRRLANESELEKILQPAGFKTVCLEECSFREQVGWFSSASVIVAVHGAGLANLVFASPGAGVLELVSPTFINHCYERLARAMSLKYCEVQGQRGTAERKRSEEDDMWISPSDLREGLGRLGM